MPDRRARSCSSRSRSRRTLAVARAIRASRSQIHASGSWTSPRTSSSSARAAAGPPGAGRPSGAPPAPRCRRVRPRRGSPSRPASGAAASARWPAGTECSRSPLAATTTPNESWSRPGVAQHVLPPGRHRRVDLRRTAPGQEPGPVRVGLQRVPGGLEVVRQLLEDAQVVVLAEVDAGLRLREHRAVEGVQRRGDVRVLEPGVDEGLGRLASSTAGSTHRLRS